MGDGILSEYGNSVGSDKLGNAVIYLGIDMIGSPRKHNSSGVVFLYPFERFFTLLLDLPAEG